MKCAFCATIWRTRKARGTRAVFSFKALLWIIGIAALVFGAYQAVLKLQNPTLETSETTVASPGDARNVGDAKEEMEPVPSVNDSAAPINNDEQNKTQDESSSDEESPSPVALNELQLKYEKSDDLDFRSSKKRKNVSN